MTATHRTPARAGRRRLVAPSRWSLRTRLLVLLLVLLTTVSMVIVFVTAVALRGVLVDQVDNRLHEANFRWSRLVPAPGSFPSTPGSPNSSGPLILLTNESADERLASFLKGPVEPGTLGAIIDDDGTHGAFLRAPRSTAEIQDPTVALTVSQAAVLSTIPADLRSYTRPLGDQGDYRFIAHAEPGGTIVVTGLPLNQVNATVTKMTLIAGIVALIGIAAAAVAGTIIVRVTLRPLRRVAATASRVAELPLDRGEVALSVRVPQVDTDPHTEVGQVGAALNRMLGHIGAALAARHASETRMRQFLADASHELRTPLAAISGYAELTRRTHEPVPDDVRYAMSRVESEGARMTALVSDLLLLARLDSGRPLEHEPVDLSRLIVDVVSDAHVAAPNHRFALELPEEPVTVTGDGARIHQVLANLLANARTHTPPGSQVTASLAVQGAEAVISVVDNGPGIAPELLPEVFERFARGDSSRSRAAGSTGLGLAIVAAVVEAHHGEVTATSRPGRTAFTVRLPRGAAAPVPPADPPGGQPAPPHHPPVIPPASAITPAPPASVASSADAVTLSPVLAATSTDPVRPPQPAPPAVLPSPIRSPR